MVLECTFQTAKCPPIQTDFQNNSLYLTLKAQKRLTLSALCFELSCSPHSDLLHISLIKASNLKTRRLLVRCWFLFQTGWMFQVHKSFQGHIHVSLPPPPRRQQRERQLLLRGTCSVWTSSPEQMCHPEARCAPSQRHVSLGEESSECRHSTMKETSLCCDSHCGAAITPLSFVSLTLWMKTHHFGCCFWKDLP